MPCRRLIKELKRSNESGSPRRCNCPLRYWIQSEYDVTHEQFYQRLFRNVNNKQREDGNDLKSQDSNTCNGSQDLLDGGAPLRIREDSNGNQSDRILREEILKEQRKLMSRITEPEEEVSALKSQPWRSRNQNVIIVQGSTIEDEVKILLRKQSRSREGCDHVQLHKYQVHSLQEPDTSEADVQQENGCVRNVLSADTQHALEALPVNGYRHIHGRTSENDADALNSVHKGFSWEDFKSSWQKETGDRPEDKRERLATKDDRRLPAFAYRECTANGTWFVNSTNSKRWANYSDCRHTEEIADDTKYIYIFIGGFSLSLVMLIISLCIFFRFRQLRCDRITIHKNLFLSYVFTGVSWILYYILAALNGDVIISNPIWCQALHNLCQYFMVCNFLWMFCEGLYLNTIMVYAFSSGKILIFSCYAIGWGLPVIFTTVYAAIRSNDQDSSVDCWLGESALQWIVYGPVVLSIGVNVLFLINIVRLLITKLRQMPEADQTRKATRATLILVPLLGLQYLLFPIRPEPGSDLEDVYHIAVALLVSLQGAFVSLMYCFCNSEVIQVLRRRWNQHKLMHRSSMRTSANHGTTYTTMDPVTQTNTTYCSTADHKDPPIEMINVIEKT